MAGGGSSSVFVDADLKYSNNIKEYRGNTDGMDAAKKYCGAGSVYINWEDGKVYVLDDSGTWQEV